MYHRCLRTRVCLVVIVIVETKALHSFCILDVAMQFARVIIIDSRIYFYQLLVLLYAFAI